MLQWTDNQAPKGLKLGLGRLWLLVGLIAFLGVLALCGGCAGTDALGPGGAPPKDDPLPPVVVSVGLTLPQTILSRSDAGFDLRGLAYAVTERGDTLRSDATLDSLGARPRAIVPGWGLDGWELLVAEEGDGGVVVEMGELADTALAAAYFDLRESTWTSRWSCLDNPDAMRDVEDPPAGLDSLVRQVRAGGFSYTSVVGTPRGAIVGDEWSVRYWGDGVVDTIVQPSAGVHALVQHVDAADVEISGVAVIRVVAESSQRPRVYTGKLDPGLTVCPGFRGSSADFSLSGAR